MKVENLGSKIKIEAEYIEVATIVQILQDSNAFRDEEFVRELTMQLLNPIVKLY